MFSYVKIGFPVTLEIKEPLENDIPFFRQGKLREFVKNTKNQGKFREYGSDPEGTCSLQFGGCASCAMCPSCVH